MKKFFTLTLLSFMVFAASAADRQPQVIINTTNDFEVKIDGILYSGNSTTVPDLGNGMHTVQVYQVKNGTGILRMIKKRELISTTQFELRDNDVRINVDRNGQVRINQSGGGSNNDNGWRRNQDNNNNRDRDIDDDDSRYENRNGNGNSNNGRGNKYGHYKNKKKKDKHCDHCDKKDRYNDDHDD